MKTFVNKCQLTKRWNFMFAVKIRMFVGAAYSSSDRWLLVI